jgi:predicted TIM-barrel fold metal-dependent hydrolase
MGRAVRPGSSPRRAAGPDRDLRFGGPPARPDRWTGVTFAQANPGNFRGGPRLEEQDADGVDAEVLFGSARMMSHFYSDPDPEFHLAGVRAYNDWLAQEVMSVDPHRLVGLACMPALSVEAAIAEMERCLALGFRGVWLNTMPSVGSAIRPEDDPFWDAAQSNGVAVHFHVRVMRTIQKPRPKGVRGDDLIGLASVGAANMIIDMGEIIQSGVHDRFPDLTWVMVEAGSGWIPYLLEQLDDRWHRNRSWLPVELEHEPSFYYRRNWRSTFMVDRYAVENRHRLGVENILFATDYPHHGCDWPHTRESSRSSSRASPPTSERKCARAMPPRYTGSAEGSVSGPPHAREQEEQRRCSPRPDATIGSFPPILTPSSRPTSGTSGSRRSTSTPRRSSSPTAPAATPGCTWAPRRPSRSASSPASALSPSSSGGPVPSTARRSTRPATTAPSA